MKLKHTYFQKLLETITAVILAWAFYIVILAWNTLPDKIPAHYNFAGEVDSWGSKGGILFVPITMLFLYVLLTLVSFFPSVWNMPVQVKVENKVKAYEVTKTMLITLKLELVIVFTYLLNCQISTKSPGAAFLIIFLVTTFGTIAYFILKTVSVSKK